MIDLGGASWPTAWTWGPPARAQEFPGPARREIPISRADRATTELRDGLANRLEEK